MLHLVVNILLFFVILNFGWIKDQLKGKKNQQTLGEVATIPVLLGIALTLVDNLRIFFMYRLLIFILLTIIIYVVVGKVKKIVKKSN